MNLSFSEPDHQQKMISAQNDMLLSEQEHVTHALYI